MELYSVLATPVFGRTDTFYGRCKRTGWWFLSSYKFIGAIMGAGDLNIQTEDGNIGMPSNVCCVIVEYLSGGALKIILIKNRRRKLSCKVVVQISVDLARGLC